jgi:hypothetical protein
MAWNKNKQLVICSSDGYCSVASFDGGDTEANMIGKKMENIDLPEKFRFLYAHLDLVDLGRLEQETVKPNYLNMNEVKITYKNKNSIVPKPEEQQVVEQ